LRVPTRSPDDGSFARATTGVHQSEPENRVDWEESMLGDILIALLITVIAIVLGIVVHPILFFVVVLAVVYLFARVRSHR
jgi:hypothetical protein